MNKQEAIEILKDERRVYIVDGRERKLDRALDMAIEALQEPEIVRCGECRHRYEDECPMYSLEWYTIDDGDGYFDDDYTVRDETQDNGFCHLGVRSEEE